MEFGSENTQENQDKARQHTGRRKERLLGDRKFRRVRSRKSYRKMWSTWPIPLNTVVLGETEQLQNCWLSGVWFGHENEPYRVDCMCSPTNAQTAYTQAIAVDHTQIEVAAVRRMKIKTTTFVLSTVAFIFNIHAHLTTYSHTFSFFNQSDLELHEEMK